MLPRKQQDLPSSWGISIVCLHMFQNDAGRTVRTLPLRCGSMAPGPPGAKAPTKGLSTPNSMAFRLAVYASQCGLLQPHARLASGCWSGSTGRAFHPQDSDERFQDCVLTSLSSSPKLCLAQWGQPKRRILRHFLPACDFPDCTKEVSVSVPG